MEGMQIQSGVLRLPVESTESSHVPTCSPWDLFKHISRDRRLYLACSGRSGHSQGDTNPMRLFGWKNTQLTITDLEVDMEISFVCSDSPLPELCAQEIFSSFLHALFRVVDNIGGTTDFFTCLPLPLLP